MELNYVVQSVYAKCRNLRFELCVHKFTAYDYMSFLSQYTVTCTFGLYKFLSSSLNYSILSLME